MITKTFLATYWAPKVARILLLACTTAALGAEPDPAHLQSPFDLKTANASQKEWASHLGRNVVETNSVGIKLAIIPPGGFLMGSPKGEKGFANEKDDDAPQHRVQITKPFYISIYTVTQTEYLRVMGENPSWFSNLSTARVISGPLKGIDTAAFPVEKVSWDSAQLFCKRLTKIEGKSYRLPTEAEWEYACRAGTTAPFNVGATLSSAQANFIGNRHLYEDSPRGPVIGHPCAVGSFQPNSFGVYDMHGNIAQWCQDWYDANYYAISPPDNPQGPASGESRVMRGGCYDTFAAYCRSAFRDRADHDARLKFVGFRIVCDP